MVNNFISKVNQNQKQFYIVEYLYEILVHICMVNAVLGYG